jgi:hypothetical protein
MRALLVFLLCGCGTDVRFANRHVLWVVRDDRPIAVPKEREALLNGPGVRDEIFRSADRVLSMDYGREAANVNALDEVPDSSWFLDRRRDPAREDARPRPLSDDEMRGGATFGLEPPVAPYTILKAKTEGATAGFIVKDARGRKFALKLDPPGWPRLATSTEVVATRLVWSMGWFVPAIWMIDLKPSDLAVGPGAKTHDRFARTVPLTMERVHEMLGRLPSDDDHAVPAAMSFWIPGKIVGPYTYLGKRNDDSNDLYPHEDRRDLRGYSMVCAWINNIDTQELNTLDSYVGEPGRGHLLHYQQDVGGSFGSRAVGPTDYWMGSSDYFPTRTIVASLVTFGARPLSWEGDDVQTARAQAMARWPELGYFDADHFEPKHWSTMVYNPAFALSTARDRYWGAKRVLGVSARELRDAIAAGGYRTETAERLFDVLWKRRQKLLRSGLAESAPLDYFRVDGGRLCFDDLWRQAGLGGDEVRAGGAPVERILPDQGCVKMPQGGYQVVALQVKRAGQKKFGKPVRVHVIDGHVVGVER